MDEHLLRFDKKKQFCFLDFETENLNLYLSRNVPWQTAMLRVRGDNVEEIFNEYLAWDRPLNVSPGAALATRFDAAKVQRLAIPSRQVVEKVVEWTSQADYILGHNILGFDLYFIIKFYALCGKSIKGLIDKIIDTHPLAKGLKMPDLYDPKKSTLTEYQYRILHTKVKGVKTNTTTLGKEYGILHDYENLHDALVDLQLLIKIWNKLKWMIEI